LSLAKVIWILKHSVKLRPYLLCGGVVACLSMACVLCAVHSTFNFNVNFYQSSNKCASVGDNCVRM